MNIEKRQNIERQIASAAIRALLDAGYLISVDDSESIVLVRSKGHDEILGAMFSTDMDTLLVFRPEEPRKRAGWVQFVYGNDGWDVISDHTTNLESALAPATELAERLEGEA